MSGGGRHAAEGVRVLGVDPGTAVTGWGVVERRGGGFVHVAHGTVATPREATLPRKLAAIHHALDACWTQWSPTVLAVEKTFVGRNVQSAFRLGEVRGVVMLLAAFGGVEVAQYSPAEVKMAVTGNGRAEKPQVQRAIARELGLADGLAADAADALAVAICHLQSFELRRLLAVRPPRRVAARARVG